jgi:type IV secretory pathway VirB3-like protein
MNLPKTILFVSLTRPAVNRFGLPHKGGMLLIVGTQLFTMWVGRGALQYYLVGIPFFITMRALTEWDHNFFRLLQLWWKTKRTAPHRTRWGGSRLAALPAGLPRNPRDIAGAI